VRCLPMCPRARHLSSRKLDRADMVIGSASLTGHRCFAAEIATVGLGLPGLLAQRDSPHPLQLVNEEPTTRACPQDARPVDNSQLLAHVLQTVEPVQ
jgi:hypothetical protein